MAGKTSSLFIRIYVDDTAGTVRNITKSVDTIGGLGIKSDEIDVTSLADALKQFLPGLKDSELTMGGPFDDTALAVSPAASGAHKVLAPLSTTTNAATITVEIGSRAEPTTGDAKWSGEYVCLEYLLGGDLGSAPKWTSRFKPAFGLSQPDWGTK